jgi:predicted ester cyclase
MPNMDDLYARNHGLFQEIWNDRNDNAMFEYLSQHVVEHGLSPFEPIAQGFEDLVAFRNNFLLSFPDARFTVEKILVEGETSVVRFSVTATHLGDSMGIPATGRKVTFTGMGFGRWKDGKLVEVWNNFDQLGLMRQLGAVE